MTIFATPIASTVALERVVPSAAAPSLRFAGDPLMWIGVPAGTTINAFATGTVARTNGPNMGVPGNVASAWTLFQLSPLPQLNPAAFMLVPGGLPVQLVIVMGTAGAVPAQDECLRAGALLATAPAGAGSTAFMAIAFQDRLCRDPLTWAEAIAASGSCDPAWPSFVTRLAGLPGARNLRLLDGSGSPLSSGTVSVSIGTQAPQSVVLTAAMDGDTGMTVPSTSWATVAASSALHPIVAPGDSDSGVFEGSGFQLAVGARMAQILDADKWLAQPNPGVQVQRWNPGTFIEPIQEGIPYFAKLVADLRTAKPNGAAELAGWAFVKGSLTDSTIDWPLVPGDPATTLVKVIKELHDSGVDVRLLVNKFMQFDSATLDDFPELAPILFAFYMSLSPLQALLKMQTDPAGYVVGLIAVAAIIIVLSTPITLNLITSMAEYSTEVVAALQPIDPNIATWTPYRAAFADNPLVSQPPQILGHTIDDLSHLGVYHQKFVNIRSTGGHLVSYLGGIDINSDRLDMPLHRASKPFHDVQVRITGPAVADVIRSYAERAGAHGGAVPITTPVAGSVPDAGTHLVQIARTYFKPATGSPTPAYTFAPNGETTPIRTIKASIGQARDFIYIEDQYFTPPDDYVQALISAAGNGVRALFITMPYQADQPYGGRRRADVLNALSTAWGPRLHTGTPLRRFLHETPALTTNSGRMRLANDLSAGATVCDLSPLSHIQAPPFWAFVGNEMLLVHAITGAPSGTGDTAYQTVEIVRAPGSPSWGAQPVDHPAGAPVLAVQVPLIYVHAKVMIVDDIFLFVGSSNINRRGLYHDGEMNSFTIPQHLKGDPRNPARLLRSRLMAEHAGISTEIGQSLFADPLSAIPYFAGRSWYMGAHRQGLDFFGSLPPDVPLGTSDTVGGWALKVLIGSLREAAEHDVWPLLVDPTTTLDPSPMSIGPEFP